MAARARASVIDANVWIGAFDQDDSLYKKAQQALKSVKGDFVLTSDVLIETLTVLKQKAPIRSVEVFIAFVETDDRIKILHQSKTFLHSYQFFTQHLNTKLSFVDTTLLLLANQYEIVTFDKTLQKEIKKFAAT